MGKILISPNSTKIIKKSLNIVDGYVIGIKGYCINYPSFNLDEVLNIIDFCNKNNKEIYIVLNKNIHNKELEDVKNILNQLKNINGLFYYDNAIISLKNKLNLNYDLVWDQEHQVANYLTINNYYDLGIKKVHLSNDITLKEMNEIKNNTKSETIVTVFGYLPMFASQRHLIKNYLDKFSLDDNSTLNYMSKEGKDYKIIDNELGTQVYTDSIFSMLDEINNINADYILLNSYLIDDFEYVLDNLNNIENINIKYQTKPYFKDIETIYKVK